VVVRNHPGFARRAGAPGAITAAPTR
jgi:hypothetical protein